MLTMLQDEVSVLIPIKDLLGFLLKAKEGAQRTQLAQDLVNNFQQAS